jgi:acetyl-CoA C-acetyltransferase
MRALVYQGPGKKALVDRTKPEIARDGGAAIVKVTKTTICGTDLHILKGDVPTCAPGRVLGQDRWAARSQTRFSTAQAAGKFKAETVPVEVPSHKGPVTFEKDEHNRPDTRVESLAKLKPAFRKSGTITAGNAPELNSGAAAMVVADAAWAEKQSVEPMARLVSYGVGAVEPGMFGLGPVPAVRQALARVGWKIGDIELNKAFAAITLALIQEPGLTQDIVNVEGGAVAYGHPIGATGAVLTTRLVHAMRRDGIRRGLVTMCIGGGQGIALALEAVR